MAGPRGDEAALAAITQRAYQDGYEQARAELKQALADLDEARDKINERDALLVRVEAECEYIVGHKARKGSLHALGKYDLATQLLEILTERKSI